MFQPGFSVTMAFLLDGTGLAVVLEPKCIPMDAHLIMAVKLDTVLGWKVRIQLLLKGRRSVLFASTYLKSVAVVGQKASRLLIVGYILSTNSALPQDVMRDIAEQMFKNLDEHLIANS